MDRYPSKPEQVISFDGMKLYFVPLPLGLDGFGRFLNSWLLTDRASGISILVDTGPASTAGLLDESLVSLGVEKIDYLVLTHVHLDHGGGAGHFLKRFPDTHVIVSPKGREHLINPSRLWAGSLSVLGYTAEVYGRPLPVPASAVVDCEKEKIPVEIIDTPGHASHHLSCVFGDILFAGEAAGVYLPAPSGREIYLRPATPPPFRMNTSLSSLDRLADKAVSIICYGHCGFSERPYEMIGFHREQLLLWEEVIGSVLAEMDFASMNIKEICMEELLERDPFLAPLSSFSVDVRKREEYFLGNSIMGFIGYLS